jgi:hypothetical protein
MSEYADLEIGLHRYDDIHYMVDLRFSHPQSDADIRLLQSSTPALATFDSEALREAQLDATAYGKLLSEHLFAEPSVQQGFAQAFASAQSLDMALRVRLFIGPGAPELQSIRWETLTHPGQDTSLITGENICFSRYLGSTDWRPVKLRPKGDLRVLVVIANPSNVSEYAPGGDTLAPVDVDGELERARQGLGNMPITTLATPGSATLANIATALRDEYDILYLVAHGAIIRSKPYLWLEDDEGAAAVTPGKELITRIKELQQRPRLIVLASCQSAGSGQEMQSNDGGALAGLGPRLAEAGIPALLAMQGNIRMKTVEQFMPCFFSELQRDGQIDRALAVARREVAQEPDWWMPVLFMRLKSGRIWYVPGFGDDRKSFEKWPAIMRSIQRKSCTPILGNGILESLLGSQHDIARNWAETYTFPMSPHERDDLPQVSQYLSINQDPQFPRDELISYLQNELLKQYAEDLPADMDDMTPLEDLMIAVWEIHCERNPLEPHRILAELPLPIYITTTQSPLMSAALRSVGKDPQMEICRWHEDLEMIPSLYEDEPDYRPTVERPLVYHLFGHIAEPDSLVLTEDDYFDYLMGLTRNNDLIPVQVRRALTDTSLIFLGFQLDDWNFRILFRSIMNRDSGSRRKRYAHVAGQLTPNEDRLLYPERAQRYLESYFQDSDISIFWGSVEDFMHELQGQRK